MSYIGIRAAICAPVIAAEARCRRHGGHWRVPEELAERLGPDQLGPDALDPTLTAEQFSEAVSRRKAPIKPLLLDQSLIAGVGNIYADEALHRVRISPARRANRISDKNLSALFMAIRESLEHALAFILDHPDDRGRPFIVDAHDDRMRLKRKPGSFCPRCEVPLSTKSLGGRTAYYCANCQH